MRTVTAPELAVLAANTRVVAFRVKMANGEPLGTSMIDLSKYVESVSIESDIDQPVSGATVTFRRDASVTQSLSPLRTDSTLNRLDDGVTYAPQIDVKRNITIEEVTTAVGGFSVDYKLIFKGTTDTVSFEHSPISVTCRDLGAVLVDNFVETEAVYGTGAGRALELVMQDILDGNGLSVISLYTPVSPGFNITSYNQQPQSVMDALSALQQLIGWDTRYKWDGGTSAFRLTLSQPDRAKTVPDYTFGPGSYFDVTRLELDLTGIRNSVKVSYRIAATGVRSSQTYTDATSAAKYGHRFMLIQEADTSPIDTAAKALALATVAVLDLKEPKAEQELELPFFWPAELGDLYRFTDNKAHYNGNQDWAVVSVKHEISRRHHRTVLRVRGSPAGGYLTWLSLGTPPTGGGGGGGGGGGPGNKRKTHPPPSALAPIAHIFPLNTEADSTVWDLRFTATAAQGGGFGTQLTYTVKRKLGTATEATLSSGNATAFPLDLSVTRHLKASAVVEFTITDQVTLLTDTKYYPLPSQRTEIGDDGVTLSSAVKVSTGVDVNLMLAKTNLTDPDGTSGSRTTRYAATAFFQPTSGNAQQYNRLNFAYAPQGKTTSDGTGTPDEHFANVPVALGMTITAFRLRTHTGNPFDQVALMVYRQDADGSSTQLGSTQTSTGAGYATLTVGSLSESASAGRSYLFRCKTMKDTAVGIDTTRMSWFEVDEDYPDLKTNL